MQDEADNEAPGDPALRGRTRTMTDRLAELDATRRRYGIRSDDAAAAVREAREERDAKWT